MTAQEIIETLRGWSKDDATFFRTIRAICNGKLSRRTITYEQQAKMREARASKALLQRETEK